MVQGGICVMNVAMKFIIKKLLRIKMWFWSISMRYDKSRWARPKVRIRGEVLGEWIENSPLSKGDVAELLGVTRRTINRWIRETRSPRANDQKKLIDLTGLSFWKLFEEKKYNKQSNVFDN
jgi:DNA-binding XRE family transcriptional regulator